jgi:hypothetical protein
VLAVAALVAIAGVLAGCASSRGDLPIRLVASRVAHIRGLPFSNLPPVKVVREADLLMFVARRLPSRLVGPAASDFVRKVPGAELPVIERLEALELLGATPVGTTIGEMLFGASRDPGGLFDSRSDTVYVRRGPVRGEKDVLAHELTHALEFQHHTHGLTGATSQFDDVEAQRALVEGPAVLVQYLYARRYLGFTGDLRAFVDQIRRQAVREIHLPRFLLAESLFPYTDGTLFVDRVLRTAGWAGVTDSERKPPDSTEAILGAPAQRVVTPRIAARRVLGRTWQAEPIQTIGALDTALLLSPNALEPPMSLIRSWRGGSLQLWQNLQSGRVPHCERPCAGHYALIARWTWNSPFAASRATTELHLRLLAILRDPSEPPDAVLKTTLGSTGLITVSGKMTTIVLAPDAATTRALAAENH